MSSDTRPRLPNGTIASGTSLSVAEAITRQSARPVAIHGYFEAAADDRPYLCARLNGYADCRGEPHLMIGVPYHWLFEEQVAMTIAAWERQEGFFAREWRAAGEREAD